MKRDLFENKYRTSNVAKILFVDIVCFLVVTIFSVGFCYSYFSDNISVSGNSAMANLNIKYCTSNDIETATSEIQATITSAVNNTSTTVDIDTVGLYVAPGDTLTISGYAINPSSVSSYVLGRLEISTSQDTDIVWYNIENGKKLYAEQGVLQVGASILDEYSASGTGHYQQLSISYIFEGERYNNDYTITSIKFDLIAHQMQYLENSSLYNNYSAVDGYSKQCMFATHLIIGRQRSVWTAGDADVADLTLADLKTNSAGEYLINSCKDWMIMRATSTSGNGYHGGKTFKLNAYLDFANDATNKTIDTFKGNFDGNGYTISNVTADGALFNSVYGNISNLGLDGVTIIKSSDDTSLYCGSLVAQAYPSSVIQNCFAIGSSVYNGGASYDINITASNSTSTCVGGLVGNLIGDGTNTTTSTIRNCYTQLNINVSSLVGNVGGIVGSCAPIMVLIENCYFSGNVNDTSTTSYAGLIVGSLTNCGYVKNCFAISNNFVTTNNTSGNIIIGTTSEDYIRNLAYINNTGLDTTSEDYNKVTKVGNSQTLRTLALNTFKSSGAMRDAFDWNTNVWASDIYTGNKLVELRIFCNL